MMRSLPRAKRGGWGPPMEDSQRKPEQRAPQPDPAHGLPERAPGHADAPMGGLSGRKIGHYTLMEELGRGGQAYVYLASDERLNRKVVLKLIPHALHSAQARLRPEPGTAGILGLSKNLRF